LATLVNRKPKVATALAIILVSLCCALIAYGMSHRHNAAHERPDATAPTTVTALPSFNASSPSPIASKSSTSANNRLVIGTLDVPSANIHALPITPGTDEATLNTGMAGAYTWSSPGQPGVFSMAGHRVGAGGPFRQLNLVHVGDRITVLSDGTLFTYRVISNDIVAPTDTSVLNGPANESRVVLITCTPLDTFAKRIIVTGKLISSSSQQTR